MAPKKDTAASSVFIVSSGAVGIESAYATKSAANKRASELAGGTVTTLNLVGGTVTAVEGTEKPVKAKPAKKEVKKEIKEEDDEEDDEEESASAAATKPKPGNKKTAKDDSGSEGGERVPAAKKTKTPQEQRAANKQKPAKPDDADLPDNVKALLKGTGSIFDGEFINPLYLADFCTKYCLFLPHFPITLSNSANVTFVGKSIVVTGVPPVLGRKNTDKLVQIYGGHLTKSISKKTSFVVLGNDAGPTKLVKIEELGLKVYDDKEFIKLIEKGTWLW